MVIQADPFCSDLVLYNESDQQGSWEYQPFYVSDTTAVNGTIDLTPELEGRSQFRASMSGYGYLWSTTLQWSIWDMTITGHCVTALERSTWSHIKALF